MYIKIWLSALLLIAICLTGFILRHSSNGGIKEDSNMNSKEDSNQSSLEDIVKKGGVQAIISFGSPDKTFLAIWYRIRQESEIPITNNSLIIFERKKEKYEEVFRFDDKGGNQLWQYLAQFGTPNFPGVAIISLGNDYFYGPTIVIALVDNKFKVVYQGGTSEFVDLDGNGIPEIFESNWPNGDGSPQMTTVYVWDGKIYTPIMKSKWDERFSHSIISAVESYSKKQRPPGH